MAPLTTTMRRRGQDRVTARTGARLVRDDDVGRPRAKVGPTVETEPATVAKDDFTAFYREYLTVVYRFLRARTPTVQDAEDLVQQVFFKAYRARAGFRGDDAARLAWLFRIVRNETASWYRRRRDDPLPIDDILTGSREPADPEPGPERRALIANEQLALARLVGRLSEDEQELIQLRFAAGLTSVQIAAVVGCSSGAARQRLHRALDRLREWSSDDLR